MKSRLPFVSCMAMLQLITGCGQQSVPAVPAANSQNPPAAQVESQVHEAHGAGPHGGTLTDWGGGAYHVEFAVEHDKKEATVYLVGSDEKSPVPIKAEKIQLTINEPMTEMELVAMPLEGEAAGTSSRFVGTHDTMGIVKEFTGTISGEIEGTPYTGDFKEEPPLRISP